MNLADAIWNSLNNRELALLIWFGGVVMFLFFIRKVRSSIYDVLKTLVRSVVVKIFAFMALYLLCVVCLISWFVDMGPQHLKEIFLWVFTVGLVMVFKANEHKDLGAFRSLIISSLRFTIVVEFIVNFHSFSLAVELVLIPILTILILFQVVGEMKETTRYFANGIQNVINSIVLVIFVFALYKTIVNFDAVASFSNLVLLLLPSTLTLLFLPYVYFLTLYMAYNDYFIHLDFMTREMAKVKLLKWAILRHANLNLDKLTRVKQHFNKRAIYDGTDLNIYIKELCNSRTAQ